MRTNGLVLHNRVVCSTHGVCRSSVKRNLLGRSRWSGKEPLGTDQPRSAMAYFQCTLEIRRQPKKKLKLGKEFASVDNCYQLLDMLRRFQWPLYMCLWIAVRWGSWHRKYWNAHQLQIYERKIWDKSIGKPCNTTHVCENLVQPTQTAGRYRKSVLSCGQIGPMRKL
jgi:hypothetical protein